jgi:hypothetical protein
VQGLLLLSSEVIKRGFEQGSQEQVGSLDHASCVMRHTSVAQFIAVGASARADAPLPRTLSDGPPRTPIADGCIRAAVRWKCRAWQKWAAFTMLGLLGLPWSATQSLP